MPLDLAMTDSKLCVAVVTGAHGVRGAVRLKSFTAEPEAVAGYRPLTDRSGARVFALTLTGRAKDALVARIDGIDDRDAAQALKGTELFIDRAQLAAPEDEDEFYQADLIGLRAETEDGAVYGTVRAIQNFGAGDLLEVARPDGGLELLPFNHDVVPVVDLETGRVVVVPMQEAPAGDEETRT